MYSLQILSLSFLLCSVNSQIAEECQHKSRYTHGPGSSYRIWSSFPPLSTNESSVDVFSCAESRLFQYGDYQYTDGITEFSVALQEALNTSTPWTYATILSVNCSIYDCYTIGFTDYSDYLIGSYTFSDLKPNTLYTVAALTCYPPSYLCTVEGALVQLIQYSNITTTPEVPQFHINSSTTTSITVQFQYIYYTGPPPHGHEVVVENKDLNSVLSYSRYFQISILHAVISGLSPNTEYVLHIRANGSHHAGNYGRWKSVGVKTQPAIPTGDLQFAVSPRDTAAVLTISPALPYQHFDTFLFTWHREGDSGTIHEANVSVEEGGVLFLEGLKQGQRYIGNWNGNSSFQFETTKNVELTTTGESVHLTWSPPSVTEGASIIGYEASIATTEETRVIKYSSSVREVTFEGLQPLTVYEIKLRVRVSSGSSSLLQPFYSTNVTVEKSSTEAVVNGVGGVETIINGVVGAAVMLFIVGVVTVFIVGGVIVGCFIRKKRRIQIPRQEGGADNNVNMEENPAYGDLKMKDESPSHEVEDVRYTTSGDPTGQQAYYEEIVYRN